MPFLPPSSRLTRFSRRAAIEAIRLPVWVLPVKLTIWVSGLATSASPTSDPGPVTRLTVPGGKPASAISSTSSVAQWGVSLEGLSTTVFPATRAGIIFQHGIAIGKFHGVTMAATPSGSRTLIAHLSGSSDGVVSPNSRRPSPAMRKAMSIPSWTSPRVSARTLPISRVIARASRSLCSAISAPKAYRISPRFGAGVRRQVWNATSAARMARAASVASPAWNCPIRSRVSAGFRLSKVRPAVDSTHSPPMNRRNVGAVGAAVPLLEVAVVIGQTRSNAIATEPPPPRHSVARP